MTDIVENLRRLGGGTLPQTDVLAILAISAIATEAADEIERLQQKLANPCYTALWDETEKNARLTEEVERLRRERDNACHERDALVVTEEAHRALSAKADVYFAGLTALVQHLHPGASLTQMDRWDPPWPQIAEALRR